MRYAHNVGRVLGIPAQAVAILTVMMLRGPQTVAELRINSDRLHRFSDISSVEGFLHELAARPEGALVAELPRAPGARETRWTHLLAGEPIASALPVMETVATDERVGVGELVALRTSITRLEEEVAMLRATLARVMAELGLPPG